MHVFLVPYEISHTALCKATFSGWLAGVLQVKCGLAGQLFRPKNLQTRLHRFRVLERELPARRARISPTAAAHADLDAPVF